MEETEKKSAPYNTRNAALAMTLYTLGVPFAKGENGKPAGVWNTYTLDTLRGIETARASAGKRPLGLAGKSLEDGIKLAFQAGEPGNVEYLFQRTPTLYAVLEGWDEQAAAIAAMDKLDPNAPTKSQPLMILPETAGRIACQLFRTRHDFLGAKNIPPLWRRVLPMALRANVSSRAHDPANAAKGSRITGSYEAHTVKI